MSSPFAGALMMTFWAPAAICALAFSASVKTPGALDDDVDAEVAPRQVGRVLLLEDPDLPAVDDQGSAVWSTTPGYVPYVESCLNRSASSSTGTRSLIADDLHVGRALDERLERLAADAAEAIDADAGGHRLLHLDPTAR